MGLRSTSFLTFPLRAAMLYIENLNSAMEADVGNRAAGFREPPQAAGVKCR